MRLLVISTFRLYNNSPESSKYQGYVIRTHCWIGEEIFSQGIQKYGPGLRYADESDIASAELEKFCSAFRIVRQLRHRYLWIENCCIDRESSSELVESPNSMFKWYRDDKVYTAYPSDVRISMLPLPLRSSQLNVHKRQFKSTFQSSRGQGPSLVLMWLGTAGTFGTARDALLRQTLGIHVL